MKLTSLKFISFAITFLLFSFPLLSMEQVNDIPIGRYLIKSRPCCGFLCDDRGARLKSSISKKSVFIFEKRAEGFLIKNYYNHSYLNSSTPSRSSYASISSFANDIKSESYYHIFKKDGAYVIKSEKFSDYLTTNGISEEGNYLFLENEIYNLEYRNSYFIFQNFDFDF